MPIVSKREIPIPSGDNTGLITACEETTKVFDGARGPEEVIEVTLTSDATGPNDEPCVPVSVLFSPSLNGMSALSRFLDRLGQHPVDDAIWDPTSIIGTEVVFSASKNDRGFMTVDKDSIKAA